MEEKIIVLTGILTAFGLFLLERHRRLALEEKIDQLVNELERFLLTGETNLKETLDEGKTENLKNQIAAVAAQARHQLRYREEREKRLNQFMENMAHQMKTSLTALQIRIDLAQSKASRPGTPAESHDRPDTRMASVSYSGIQADLHAVQAELEECQKCMSRLTREVERILECSQLADQKIRMHPERCDILPLIRSTITTLQPLWMKKEVSIVPDLSGLSGISGLYLDPYWFSQAFENVIKNAIEHTPAGSMVTITGSDCGRSLVLEVKDEGPGIHEDELPYLFERFHRGSYGKAGYGIGLNMAEDILKAHHGSIQAVNHKNGGACFRLELPLLSGSRPYEIVSQTVSES